MAKRALLSVSDKQQIDMLANQLISLGFEIISTGGTAKFLAEKDIKTTSVEDITHFPECLSGRVKTMHPLLMGGILYRRGDSEHEAETKKLGIDAIDMIVVNLYPFEQTLEQGKKAGKSGADFEKEMVEQIDIGGPTMLRSAAKNHASVTVICDPADYSRVIDEIKKNGDTSPELRKQLAAKVFAHTARYDGLIAEFFTTGANQSLQLTNGRVLRYGENPHQWGKFYELDGKPVRWKVLQGKELSYLNILDSDAAWQMACDFTAPTAVFVKHANPSGIASDSDINVAFQKGYDTDRLSAFGVIIALNKECTEVIAKKIIDQKIFTEIILAPSYEAGVLEILKQKPNIRVIELPLLEKKERVVYRSAFDGMLVQSADSKQINEADLQFITSKKPTPAQIQDLLFAWKVVKHAKSNAIVLAKDGVTVGIGAGQTSRVDSTWISIKRAGERVQGSVLASDAFFPFPDALTEAAKAGVVAIIQPGGSVKDAEVFAAAEKLGIAMVLTGTRAFRH